MKLAERKYRPIVCLAGALLSGAATAQTAATNTDELGEIVVTATRRVDTVHNIPMTIDAVTPEQIDEQGLKTPQDIARVVPNLYIGATSGFTGDINVAIRGIQSASGASTTGIYIDDVNITQRNINQPLAGGSVIPQLYDLERVEVLQGPQGTLYGGSSEGGTLRFITGQPDLNTQSGKIKMEGTTIHDGSNGYDLAGVFNTPLIPSVLALHASAEYRRDGGYLDHVSQFTGDTIASNTNWSENTTVHVSVLWQPVDHFSVNASYLYTRLENNDSDFYWENIPAYFGPPIVGGAPTHYGPYNMFGPYRNGQNTDIGANYYTSDAQLSPNLNSNAHQLSLPSVTLAYDAGAVDIKSITAYAYSQNSAILNQAYADTEHAGFPPYVASVPVYHSALIQGATNRTFSEELRVSSTDAESRLSYVAGLYFSHAALASTAVIPANFADLISGATGIPETAAAAAATGAPVNPATDNGIVLDFPEHLTEQQEAIFGEATFSITEQFKATAGLRYTINKFDATALESGALFGIPLDAPVASIDQVETDKPFTPKFGLQYFFDRNTNVYATAAKGFRPGGANSDLRTSPQCAAALIENYGSVANQALTYKSDSLWSYELGMKTRPWGDRVNLNVSAFYIDWKNPQVSITLLDGCNQPTTVSANADIISKGGDFQGSYKLLEGVLLTTYVSYTDTAFNGAVSSPGASAPIFERGDRVPYTSKVSASVGIVYNFAPFGEKAFLRADYQYRSSFLVGSGAGPGTTSYAIDNYSLPGTRYLTARAGLFTGPVEWNAFVNNLTDSRDLLNRFGFAPGGNPGRTCDGPVPAGCGAPVLGAYDLTFTPRTVGLSGEYRF